GLASGVVTVNLRLSDDPVADDSDVLLGSSTKSLKLKPNKTSDREFKFNYPTTVDGNFYILAQIDTAGAVTESDETNNTAQSTSPGALAHPFVVLSIVSVPTSPAITRERPATALVTVLNSGNISISQRASLQLYRSTDSTGSAGAVTLVTANPKISLK